MPRQNPKGREGLGGVVKRVWKSPLSIALTGKFTWYICILKALRTPEIKEPVQLHLILYFPPLLMQTLCSCHTQAWGGRNSVLPNGLSGNTAAKLVSQGLPCLPLACLPFPMGSEQLKHLYLVRSRTGSLRTASALCSLSQWRAPCVVFLGSCLDTFYLFLAQTLLPDLSP